MNEVKGGIVIDQLKRYAKRLSDYSGESAVVHINIWCHLYQGEQSFDIEIKASHMSSDFIKPRFETEDLRDLGKAIDDYINGNTKTRKESEK